MKENDIRPALLMVESNQLQAEDIKRILVHRQSFVTVPCPACESDSFDFSFEKRGFDFVTCGNCQTLYINPRPTAEMLAHHYQNSLMAEYWDKHIYPTSEEARRTNMFAPRAARVIDLCKQHGVKPGKLLDVGAGFGTFCQEIERLKFFKETIALEPSHHLAESCRQRGLQVIEKPVEDVGIPGGFDVITNFELIEHLFSPKEFLMQCSELLVEGGLLILTTPNIKGFDLMVLRELSDNILGPTHINYFHDGSLRILLKKCGLDVVETLTPGKLDADIVKTRLDSRQLNLDSQPFLKEIFVERWDTLGAPFQKFLADNGLSSHLWVVARKSS
jgi:2-polyprenyl-3-methyl-5-hydroxy-6-metoxy-1,4-benzoquinol methylase